MGFCYTLQPRQTPQFFHRWAVHPELSWHLAHFLHMNCLCLYDLLNPGSLGPSLWTESHADLKMQAAACTAEWHSSPWKPPWVLRPGLPGQTACRFLIPMSELPRVNAAMAARLSFRPCYGKTLPRKQDHGLHSLWPALGTESVAGTTSEHTSLEH